MRLLHEVIDDRHQHAGAHAILPLGRVLEALLGGERHARDLVDRPTQAGPGPIMASRIGHRPNLPIHPGMPSAELLNRLCRLLPLTVAAMTPEGERGEPVNE